MLIKSLLLGSLAACLLTAPIYANPLKASVACVQEGLNVLGHDAGSVDGVFGNKTRIASQKLQVDARYSDLPPLTKENAIVWCRVLGERDPKVKELWPSMQDPISVLFGGAVTEPVRKIINQVVDKSYNRLVGEFEVALAGQVKIVVSGSDTQVVDLVHAELGQRRSKSQIRGDVRRYCKDDKNIGGAAYRGLILLCGPLLNSVPSQAKALEYWSTRVVIHEMIHEFQYQLAGYHSLGTFSWKAGIGPKWVREGTASALELTLAHNEGVDPELAWFQERYAEKLSKLASKESDKGWGGDGATIAGFAGLLLLRDNGAKAIGDHYRLVGLGNSPNAAFESAFGTSPKQFYKSIQK